ncbi:flavodoxin domain-containing protein [Pseudooceanicola sp. LIPI14-2-Ac024]|uniref:flavodoxin domain-containing protein n=1 Tax=Pseudooceanicola sp. LIPI14-2-Ac024 TaxID=3344875 RepID=UPI0035D08491
MRILIIYASREGQARKIARRAAERIADAGHAVELMPVAEAERGDVARCDRVILAASIHVGHYDPAVATFVAEAAEALRRVPTLFLSVSLAAAGHTAEDWRGLDKVIDDFCAATHWTPDRVEQLAGAYRPSRYDVVRRFVMRRIIAAKDPGADLDADREYTDWPALDALIDSWLG